MKNAEPRRCPSCGAEQRFSHRRYAGRGVEVAVFRCTVCGRTGEAQVQQNAAADRDARAGRRKPPVDEGPPANPVIDPDTARRLLGR